MMLNILIIILAIASFSCSGGGGGGGGGASTGSVSPSILLSIVSIAQEDKVYSSDISTVLDSLSASTVVLENAPTWLTYDASAKKITGIPDSNATVSNLKINVTIVGVTTTHGLVGPHI